RANGNADTKLEVELLSPSAEEPFMATCLPEAGGILSRRQFLRTFAAAGSIACLAAMPIVAPAAPKASSLAWGDIERLVKQQLATRHGYRAGDLISRSEVETVLQLLEQSG